MSEYEAWNQLFKLGQGNQWVKIPQNISKILGLGGRLGICHGNLCTRVAAEGANDFINRINGKMERLGKNI